MSVRWIPDTRSAEVAYSPPYSIERWNTLVNSAMSRLEPGRAQIFPVGATRGLSLQTPASTEVIWIVAREHPGESAAAWVLEGLILEILNIFESNAEAAVPHLAIAGVANPEGIRAGAYRANASGINISHEWKVAQLTGEPVELWDIQREARRLESVGLRTGMILNLHAHNSRRTNFAFFTHDPQVRQNEKSLQFLGTLAGLTANFDLAACQRISASGSNNALGWFNETFSAAGVVLEVTYHDLAEMGRTGEYMSVTDYMTLGRNIAIAMIHISTGRAPR